MTHIYKATKSLPQIQEQPPGQCLRPQESCCRCWNQPGRHQEKSVWGPHQLPLHGVGKTLREIFQSLFKLFHAVPSSSPHRALWFHWEWNIPEASGSFPYPHSNTIFRENSFQTQPSEGYHLQTNKRRTLSLTRPVDSRAMHLTMTFIPVITGHPQNAKASRQLSCHIFFTSLPYLSPDTHSASHNWPPWEPVLLCSLDPTFYC